MKLANKNAIPEAIKLYEYLCALSGKGILTGQHTQTRGMEEIGHIQRLTGKKPALNCLDIHRISTMKIWVRPAGRKSKKIKIL